MVRQAGATVPAAGGKVTETSPRSFESILFASENVTLPVPLYLWLLLP